MILISTQPLIISSTLILTLGATCSSNANEGLNNLVAMFVSKRIKVHKHYRMFADFAIPHKDLGVLMLLRSHPAGH